MKSVSANTSAAFWMLPTDESPASKAKRKLWQNLSPLQRALMATDGSFTLLISAITGEKIVAEPLSQTIKILRNTHHELELDQGDRLLERQVLLKTAETGKSIVYASSAIVLSRLNKSVRNLLEEGSKPIGLLLYEHGLETRRHLLDWGECQKGHKAFDYLGPKAFFRSYVISAHRMPIMVVSEYFN